MDPEQVSAAPSTTLRAVPLPVPGRIRVRTLKSLLAKRRSRGYQARQPLQGKAARVCARASLIALGAVV